MIKFTNNNWVVKDVIFFITNSKNTIRVEKDNEKEYLLSSQKLKLYL